MAETNTTPPAAAEEPSAIAVLREADGMNLYASIDRGDGGEESTGYLCAVTDIVSLYDTLAARVAELEAENVAERQKFADHASKIIDATGVEVPANGMTALEAVAALQQRVAAVERELSHSDAIHDALTNEMSLCHQCMSEYEHTVSMAVERWEAENPEQEAALAAAPAATQQTNGDQSNG